MYGILSLRTLSKEQKDTLRVLDRALSATELFLVGGTVRDLLLERQSKDLDVLVRGMSISSIKKHLASYGNIQLVGARFGVLKFTPRKSLVPKRSGGSITVDVALPRTEKSFGTGGYRDFTFTSNPKLSVESDLSRRDFTINAMAYNVRTKELVDPFGGMRDLERRVLRAVGKPEQRFAEDYSRLLRLLRFAAALEFSIEAKTVRSAKRLVPQLNKKRKGEFVVPREVIAEQLIKMFTANPVKAFDLCDAFGVFAAVLPEVEKLKKCTQDTVFHSEGTVFAHTRLALERLAGSGFQKTFGLKKPSALVVFGTLLHDVGKPERRAAVREKTRTRIHFYGHDVHGATMVRHIAEHLKLSSYQGLVPTDDVVWLVRHHMNFIASTVAAMRPSTIAQYFAEERGTALLQVMWADGAASIRPNGNAALKDFRFMMQRIRSVLKKEKRNFLVPKPLLNGNEVMRVLQIPSGPQVGKALHALRDVQLQKKVRTKAAAKHYLARWRKNA